MVTISEGELDSMPVHTILRERTGFNRTYYWTKINDKRWRQVYDPPLPVVLCPERPSEYLSMHVYLERVDPLELLGLSAILTESKYKR